MKNSESELICEVCGKEKAVGVFCVPMVPISVAYGRECLEANAHPWGILIANTACINGLEFANEDWKQMVYNTCNYLGKTIDEFNKEVEETIKEVYEMMRKQKEKEDERTSNSQKKD